MNRSWRQFNQEAKIIAIAYTFFAPPVKHLISLLQHHSRPLPSFLDLLMIQIALVASATCAICWLDNGVRSHELYGPIARRYTACLARQPLLWCRWSDKRQAMD